VLRDVHPAAVKWNALEAAPPTTTAGPFQQQLDLRIRDGANAIFAPVTVPDGLRLVIESVSLYGSVPSGEVPDVSLTSTVRGAGATYHLALTKQDTRDKVDWITANQAMRLYGDPPSVVLLIMRPGTAGDSAFTVSISGYLTATQ
jgi:hypothetical protein